MMHPHYEFYMGMRDNAIDSLWKAHIEEMKIDECENLVGRVTIKYSTYHTHYSALADAFAFTFKAYARMHNVHISTGGITCRTF